MASFCYNTTIKGRTVMINKITMDYKKELDKALDHISSSQEALGWVGGDAYEMECVGNMTEGINEFVAKHRPETKQEAVKEVPDKRFGKYALRKNTTIKVFAHNKKHAKNLLNVGKGQVICITPPSY